MKFITIKDKRPSNGDLHLVVVQKNYRRAYELARWNGIREIWQAESDSSRVYNVQSYYQSPIKEDAAK